MQLFNDLNISECLPQPLTIETPLGTILSSATIDSHLLNFANSNCFYSIESGGYAARWELPSGVAEMIISRPMLIPEYREEVKDCWAFLWRIKALQPIDKLVFQSSWASGYTWNDGGPDSGQNLDAQTWDDGQSQVSLGTEGGDALFARAEANDWLPHRFIHQSPNQWDLPFIRYFDEGLVVNFEKVLSGELLQSHFAVSWSQYDMESIGTWNAVQLSGENIIEGITQKNYK